MQKAPLNVGAVWLLFCMKRERGSVYVVCVCVCVPVYLSCVCLYVCE